MSTSTYSKISKDNCASAAIIASRNGTHDINNVGACISYRGQILSTGWNSGERCRVTGSLGYTSTPSVTSACNDCASVHAEVAAWMKLDKAWKMKSRTASRTSSGSVKKKGCRGSPYCEKEGFEEWFAVSSPLGLYRSDHFHWKAKGGQALRRVLTATRSNGTLQVDLLY